MPDLKEILQEGVDLLSERHGDELDDYQWTHVHCDEDSGGNHRLDGLWLDEDIVAWLKRAAAALKET